MERNQFIKTILGTTILTTMYGFSSLANAISQDDAGKFASFGAIHLNNTSLEKSTLFWTKIVGMKLRKSSATIAEFGTETKTLVVVHETAKKNFQKGYSGLYHFAIHSPNKEEFASMVHRVAAHRYPFSPVDHTMSKSIYLDDPDGINIEFTLETPERFKRVVTTGGLKIEDADGNVRSASDYLNMDEVFNHLKDNDVNKIIDEGTYIGHLHLYANNVQNSNEFYQEIGFNSFNYLPQYMYADLGAGGAYQHRIALNSWHGINKPLAPSENAGMKYFHIHFNTPKKLKEALNNEAEHEEKDDGFWFKDPTGNNILLTSD